MDSNHDFSHFTIAVIGLGLMGGSFAKRFKAIGRRVIGEIQKLAREQHIPKLHAEIYSFNAQSQRMFERAGFHKAGDELYEMEL